jgi:ATP diphosphatase
VDPAAPAEAGAGVSDVGRLLEIMARLRDPQGGCPWDLEQDFASIAPYTIEEAYEVDDAIRRGDLASLREELGDLLLQVVFHAQMAREAGHFDFGDVVEAICDKLVDRHPHVFGDAVIATARAQTDAWERRKAEERARGGAASAADGVPLALPALLRARKLLSRAARAGFASPLLEDPAAGLARAFEALRIALGADDAAARLRAQGELLLAAAAFCGPMEVDPEQALREALARFEAELREWERGRATPPG